MLLRLMLLVFLLGTTTYVFAQDPWNAVVGGGVGFPLSDMGDFVSNSGHIVVGAGGNFNPAAGANVEFMWHDLPFKDEVLESAGILESSAMQYALTLNGILQTPSSLRLGFYGIGGIGWYHRSAEITAPTLVAGTVCDPFFVWWGVTCVNGLFPADVVLDSSSSDAFGGNVGGGVTFRLGEGGTKFYTEIRYHHAGYDTVDTNILPLTFGFRW
jgi:hypothetical protein